MKKSILPILALSLAFGSCQKDELAVPSSNLRAGSFQTAANGTTQHIDGFYTIEEFMENGIRNTDLEDSRIAFYQTGKVDVVFPGKDEKFTGTWSMDLAAGHIVITFQTPLGNPVSALNGKEWKSVSGKNSLFVRDEAADSNRSFRLNKIPGSGTDDATSGMQ